MPKSTIPFTDKAIKAFKPKEKIYRVSDGKNLFLKVLPSAKKVFEMEYKSPTTKKLRRITIGEYGEISLSEARQKAYELRAKIKDNIDPLDEKPSEFYSFKEVALRYLNIKANPQKDIRRLEMYVFPYLAQKDIKDIKADEVIAILKKLENADKLETLSRIFSILKQIYKSVGAYTHNIITDINYKYTFKAYVKQNYPTITAPSEIKTLLQAIRGYKGRYHTKVALLLGIYTALRPFNIRTARWEEIDLEAQIWTIPAQKMKTRKLFVLPLSRQIVEILKEYKSIVGVSSSGFVFENNIYKDRPMSENAVNTALRRLGYGRDEIVGHGFRAMFSSIAYEYISTHKQSGLIIEKCLAHEDTNKIRSAYNRAENLNEMRILFQWYADFLENL